jgi:exodeoxyribonuclease-3
MKLISFNTNGIRARMHQLERLIEKHQPDVIGIQETKVADDQFPREQIEAMGYHVVYHGQKGHYGVCLISREPAINVEYGFPGDEPDAQRRMIMAEFNSASGKRFKVLNGYFPQGENIAHETKFPAKRRFYADLLAYLQSSCSPEQPLVVMGDLNISAEDKDIGIGEVNRKRWLKTGKTSFQPVEREWLDQLKQWGLGDSFRVLHPEENNLFSWFDYRSRGFDDDPRRGLRIDAIMATPVLLEHCHDAGIDYEIRGMEKPSDHAPVWASFEI